jgi:hypothetical protein
VTPELHFWPAPLQALALVVSPRLKLQQKIPCPYFIFIFFPQQEIKHFLFSRHLYFTQKTHLTKVQWKIILAKFQQKV